MGLFKHRPLCFFCFLFLLTSVLLCGADYNQKLFLIFLSGVALVICVLLFVLLKTHRIRVLTLLLSVAFVLLALVNSFFRMDIKQKEADRYRGSSNVCMSILSDQYNSSNTSVYTVRIEKVEDTEVSIKALAVCAFPTDLNVGDRVLANVELMDTSERALGKTFEQRNSDPDILIGAVLYESEGVMVDRFDRDAPLWNRLCAANGLLAVSHDAKQALLARIDSILGAVTGSLAKGFLLGEKSDMPTDVIRDFRRSGVSHLFAVSGLHISILIGFAELILRKLLVHKYFRCAINSVLAFALLVLTGFSMSAMRAVLMLWIVYLVFILSDDADSPTTLFLAATVILLIFPYSVYSLGLWMSFLATLGLVTLYPLLESSIPRVTQKDKKKLSGSFLGILRKIFLVVAMTLICNMFLLPIQWKIFGEISLASVPANLLLSPLTPLFLALCVLSLIFGNVIVLGDVLSYLAGVVCKAVLWVVRMLSSWGDASVSLEYFFADVLVILFAVSAVLVLVIKLRRKYLIAVPFVAFVVAFSSCVMAFNIIGPQKITHYYDGRNETVTVCDAQKLCIIDMSNGAYFRFSRALYDASDNGATAVDKIVFTRLTRAHVSSMDYFLRSEMVEEIYIPYPLNDTQMELSKSLAKIADECSVKMVIYKNGEIISHYDTSLCVIRSQIDDKECTSVFVGGREKLVGFVDAFSGEAIDEYVKRCDTVVVGNRANVSGRFNLPVSDGATLIYLNEDTKKNSNINKDTANVYVNTKPENSIELRLN